MKKKYLLKFTALLLVCFAMFGCGKEESEMTTIYGTVFNSVTHEPIVGAQIEVGYRSGLISSQYDGNHDYRISSSVSGFDGQFELQFGKMNVDDRMLYYYMYGNADGYYDSYQPTGITIGSNSRMDINLDPK
ncbi:MAG: hypothetical protein K6F96_08765 [Bacteroidales bacterium]|nr:hypothetical protein [Bacteroidales bacterium]